MSEHIAWSRAGTTFALMAQRGWRRSGGFVLLVVGLALLVRLPGMIHQLYDPDEAAIAAVAISERDGGTIYIDAIDRKPPVPALLFAASFSITGNTDLRPLRALMALGLAGAGLVVAADARRRHGESAARWAAGLMVLGAVAFFPIDAQAANFAHVALFPGAVAVVFSVDRRRWAPLLTGVALGVAILSRQSWLVGVLPALVGVVSVATRGRRGRLEAAGLFTVGLAATIAAIGFFVPFSDFWHWTFSSNTGFVAAGAPLLPTVGRTVATVAIFVAFHLTLVVVLVALARRRAEDVSPFWRDPAGSQLAMWLWVITGGASVVAGFRFFGHYWLQALPPMVVLAAPMLAAADLRWQRWARAGLVVPAVLAFSFAWVPGTFRTLPDPDGLVAYVEQHTEPGDPVWIWGSFPEVYLEADRPPGGALVHSDFVTGRSGGRPSGPETVADATPGAEAALLRSLRADPPALVLDTSTADIREYGRYPLTDFPDLATFLVDHYDKVAVVDEVQIWAPKP